jgi:Protein of unknown function (DUF3179)
MKFLAALVILTIALILAPLVVALPPVNQTPQMLAFAHVARTLAPIASLLLCALSAIQLWRSRTWRAAALLAVALICVPLSRVNLLERVFAPARTAETSAVSSFHDIRDTDMVIGVLIAGQARAYPVRYLAYHHMLNDQLGSTALLPTY